MVVGVGLLPAAPASGAKPAVHVPPRVTIVMLPNGTTIDELASIPGMSLGLMSGGIGEVPPGQTYLDMTQGNRINRSLYDSGTPHTELVHGGRAVEPERWRRIVGRAAGAPSDLVPGVLASTLERAGFAMGATPGSGQAAVIAADEDGRIGGASGAAVVVSGGDVQRAASYARELRDDDLLIAIEAPPAAKNQELAVGIAGQGFDGNLTSESTHTEGLVLSTDLAPTILGRLGVAAPDAVAGQPITSSGDSDPGALSDLEERLAEVGPRRHTVVGDNLIIWAALTLLAAAVFRRRGLRIAIPLLAATLAFAPALMLIAPAFQPSEIAERLIVGAGAPVLAILCVRLAGPWGAFAIGAWVSVGGYAVDVVAGSYLTTRSMMGPNPSLGVRFYGIGNELEAMVVALTAGGAGAALQRWAPRFDPRRAAAVFGVAGFAAVVAFAPGRFGADVGAAIDIPVAAAVAIAVCLGARRGRALAILALPFLALALLALADLVTGGDSHLTRSVLQAGGLHNLGDVAERRLRLSAMSYSRYFGNPAFWAALAFIVAGVARWRAVRAWFAGADLAWAGFVGAAAGTVVGTLANDSGALLMMIGTSFTAVCAGIAWAQASPGETRPPPVP
jgi:hypothetical protein